VILADGKMLCSSLVAGGNVVILADEEMVCSSPFAGASSSVPLWLEGEGSSLSPDAYSYAYRRASHRHVRGQPPAAGASVGRGGAAGGQLRGPGVGGAVGQGHAS